jgi:hypothetical protein
MKRDATPSVPANLEHLLEQLESAGGRAEEISIGDVRDAVGRRSFAPLLLLVTLLGFTPLGGVPGVPTFLAIIVILIAGQVALGHRHLWAPAAVLNRQVDKRKLQKAARALKPFARTVDKVVRPRLPFLTEPPYSFMIAVTCVLLALSVPPLELVPLVDLPLWGAMVAFSLALFAHDGLLAIAAWALTGVGVFLAVTTLL